MLPDDVVLTAQTVDEAAALLLPDAPMPSAPREALPSEACRAAFGLAASHMCLIASAVNPRAAQGAESVL